MTSIKSTEQISLTGIPIIISCTLFREFYDQLNSSTTITANHTLIVIRLDWIHFANLSRVVINNLLPLYQNEGLHTSVNFMASKLPRMEAQADTDICLSAFVPVRLYFAHEKIFLSQGAPSIRAPFRLPI